MSCGARRTVWMPCRPPRPPCSHKRRDIMEPNIPSPVCRKDGVEIHAAVPKDITEAFSVIAVRENGAWLLVRHSARKTWELPGGHREPDETPLEAACRELYEETGALRFRLCACGCYSVTQGGQTSWGALFLAEAITRGPLPESEIAQVRAFAALPSALTYPTIQPVLHACAGRNTRRRAGKRTLPRARTEGGTPVNDGLYLRAVGIAAAVQPDYSFSLPAVRALGVMGRLRLKNLSFCGKKTARANPRCWRPSRHTGFQSRGRHAESPLSTARTHAELYRSLVLQRWPAPPPGWFFPSGQKAFTMLPQRSTVWMRLRR